MWQLPLDGSFFLKIPKLRTMVFQCKCSFQSKIAYWALRFVSLWMIGRCINRTLVRMVTIHAFLRLPSPIIINSAFPKCNACAFLEMNCVLPIRDICICTSQATPCLSIPTPPYPTLTPSVRGRFHNIVVLSWFLAVEFFRFHQLPDFSRILAINETKY